MEIRDGTEKGKGFMEPGNICIASDSGGGRGWRRRVEIRPWSLSPGFSVCQGQVSALKSRENHHCPFRTSSGGTATPEEEKHCSTPSPFSAQLLLSSHSPRRGMLQVVLPTPRHNSRPQCCWVFVPLVVDFQVFPETPITPSA